MLSPAAIAAASGPYAVFQYCPYADPDLQDSGSCLYDQVTSGSLAIGSTTLPITQPIVLQGGVLFANGSPLYAAVGAPTLAAPPAQVPGGLLGIANPAPNWDFILWTAFWNIVNTANGVTATMEPVDTIQTNLANALFPPTDGSDAVAITLPVRVHLQNPFLGDTCFIGSQQNPIVVRLQVTPTNPPPPNKSIAGDAGTYNVVYTDPVNYVGYTRVDNNILVDNAFAVPAASGCGNVALGLPIVTPILESLVSAAVNLKVGLPSAAGKNTAIMKGTTYLALASTVLAASQQW
jgi:hypothetical protein